MRGGAFSNGLREAFTKAGKGVKGTLTWRRRQRELIRQRESILELLAKREKELSELKAGLAPGSLEPGHVKSENVIWIFCTGRSGSTWLAAMLGELQNSTVWTEPLVGDLFGTLYYVRSSKRHHNNKNFILGRYEKSWLRSIRTFVLNEARARFPRVSNTDYLIIKEPNGSIGAPLLARALPESRIVLLIRDPRDVTASSLDASKEGGWRWERLKESAKVLHGGGDAEDPDAFVEARAKRYARDVTKAKEAYEAHEGPKALVFYEDLMLDTRGEMRRILQVLGIEADECELARAVDKHSWANISEERKGEGKFYRKAKPGSWSEDLTPEQVQIVEEITAPLLKEFYPNNE